MKSQTSIPGIFLPHMEQFVSDHGGDIAALYRKAGLDRDLFNPHKQCVSEDQLHTFVQEAVIQSGKEAFGIEIGRRFSVSSFGLLSRALLSCSDVSSAIKLIERYSTLALPLVRCFVQENNQQLILEFKLLSHHEALNQIIVEALLSLWHGAFKSLTGNALDIEKITLVYSQQPYSHKYFLTMAKNIEFDSDRNRIYLNKVSAKRSIVTANPIDANFSIAECELELIKSRETSSLTEKVTDQVRFYLNSNPRGKDIASRLNLTERTMRRRLGEEGTGFREILQQVRTEMAGYYLSQTDLKIDQIALKLGYQSSSNFRAAFKQWTGFSPRDWRNRK